MDEPLLGRSSSQRYTKKSEHPVLGLISSAPGQRSGRRTYDPSTPCVVLSPAGSFKSSSSPNQSQPSSPPPPPGADEGDLGQEFREGAAPVPPQIRTGKFSRSSSIGGAREAPCRISSLKRPSQLSIPEYECPGVCSLQRIPEEPRQASGASVEVQDGAPERIAGATDEPLLGRSSSRKYTKKSEHPVFSLISPSPGQRSGRWRFDPSTPYAVLSPAGSFKSCSSSGQSQCSSPRAPPGVHEGDQGPEFRTPQIRTEKCSRSSSFGGAREPRTEKYSRSSSVGGAREPPCRIPSLKRPSQLSIPEYDCPRIPEEPRESSVEVQDGAPDLEAQRHTSRAEDTGGDEHGPGVFEEPLTPDGDEAKREGRCWRAEVKDFLYTAIPTIPSVFEALTVFPGLEFPHSEAGQNAPACNADPDLEPRTPRACVIADLFTPGRLFAPSSIPENVGDGEAGPCDDEAAGLPAKCRDDASKWLRGKKGRPFHKCRTAPSLITVDTLQQKMEQSTQAEKAPVQSPSYVVRQAFVGLLAYLIVGVVIFSWKRDEFTGLTTVGVVDALYFCIVTMCTIGYGDITPTSVSAKLLSCCLMFVGFGFIDALLSGMLTFVLDRQEHLLLNVVEDGHHERTKNYVMDTKKGRMRIRMKVALAVGTVFLMILIGVFFLHFMEGLKWVDSLYVTCISITTVGYGDFSFQTLWGRLFAAMWLLMSTLGVARAFIYLAEARVHRRHRRLAKRILQRKMTTSDLLVMDLDDDSHVSKSEFLVYKLKEMGKIEQLDIEEICNQFNFLDKMDVGKITLSQLLENDG